MKKEEDVHERSGGTRDSPEQRSGGERVWSSTELEANKRGYLDREVERRVQELLIVEKARSDQEKGLKERDSHKRKGCVTWSDGVGSEGSQQRPQSASGSRWEGNLWDMAVPQQFKIFRQVDARGEGKEPWAREVGNMEGGPTVGLFGASGKFGHEAWRMLTATVERGEPTVEFNRQAGGLWPQPGALETHGSWLRIPGTYVGFGGAIAR